jgi:hypothetical protein
MPELESRYSKTRASATNLEKENIPTNPNRSRQGAAAGADEEDLEPQKDSTIASNNRSTLRPPKSSNKDQNRAGRSKERSTSLTKKATIKALKSREEAVSKSRSRSKSGNTSALSIGSNRSLRRTRSVNSSRSQTPGVRSSFAGGVTGALISPTGALNSSKKIELNKKLAQERKLREDKIKDLIKKDRKRRKVAGNGTAKISKTKQSSESEGSELYSRNLKYEYNFQNNQVPTKEKSSTQNLRR